MMDCYDSEARLLFASERANLLANEMRAARRRGKLSRLARRYGGQLVSSDTRRERQDEAPPRHHRPRSAGTSSSNHAWASVEK